MAATATKNGSQTGTRPNEVALPPGGGLITKPGEGVQLRTLAEAREFAREVIASGMAPKSYVTEEQVLIAMQYGAEVGLKPLQSLQAIAVVNRRPCLWGDSLIALAHSSGLLEDFEEKLILDQKPARAICRVKRKGVANWFEYEFSWDDAKAAGLTEKDVWKSYPKRMLQMRARSWAFRAAFADVLSGLHVAEEAMGIPVEEEPPPRTAGGQTGGGFMDLDGEVVEQSPLYDHWSEQLAEAGYGRDQIAEAEQQIRAACAAGEITEEERDKLIGFAQQRLQDADTLEDDEVIDAEFNEANDPATDL